MLFSSSNSDVLPNSMKCNNYDILVAYLTVINFVSTMSPQTMKQPLQLS
jgi:hypothetical protein